MRIEYRRMGLKAKLSKDDHAKLAPALQECYVDKDGSYELDAEGVVPEAKFAEQKAKLEEFRDRNRDLNGKVGEVETLKATLAKFDGVDPDEYRQIKSSLDKKGVKKVDELESLVSDAIAKAVAPINQKLDASEKARLEAQTRADGEMLKSQIASVARETRVRGKATSYLVNRAADVFVVKQGVITARDGQYSPEDPTRPLSIEEWVKSVATEEDLFELSRGADAGGGKPDGPPVKELVNPTPAEKGRYLDDIASGKLRVVQR